MTELDLIIQQLNELINGLKAENESLKAMLQEKWIPADDERKPKYAQEILATLKAKDGAILLCNYHYFNSLDLGDLKCLAWQPTPPKYVGECE